MKWRELKLGDVLMSGSVPGRSSKFEVILILEGPTSSSSWIDYVSTLDGTRVREQMVNSDGDIEHDEWAIERSP